MSDLVRAVKEDARCAANEFCGDLFRMLDAWGFPFRIPDCRNRAKQYDREVKLTIDLDREDDGRWIAEALELPGVMSYGNTRDEAISNVERLAIEVIADRIAHGELPSSALGVAFTIPDEHLASH